MIEEAAGTKMYEIKKQQVQKTMEKKDQKFSELKAILNDELAPKLDKLRAERIKYMEFKRVERELEHLLRLYQAWEYFACQGRTKVAQEELEKEENQVKQVEADIKTKRSKIQEIEEEIVELENRADKVPGCLFIIDLSKFCNFQEGNQELQKAESELKLAEKEQAKLNARMKSVKDNIAAEKQKIKQLEKVQSNLNFKKIIIFFNLSRIMKIIQICSKQKKLN